MQQIVLFHSVLGLRQGVLDAADRLRGAGHDVRVVDQYDGRVFDAYPEASSFAEGIGYPELMGRALAAVEDLADGFIVAGFSNGGGMAEYVATQREVSGVVMLSGTLPLDMIGQDSWPTRVPAQIHYAIGDPFRDQDFIGRLSASIRDAGAHLETYDYPGTGHLFTDKSLPEEYEPDNAALLWRRVLAFCAEPAS